MQQQQNQQIQQYEPKQEISRPVTQAPFSEAAKYRVISRLGMTEQQWAIYDAAISIGLLTLRTAFPTQTRSYSGSEHDMLTALWLEIFAEVEPDILQKAIMRFITTDRKGFFPAPGQVMGIAEEIQAEIKAEAEEKRKQAHYAYLRELQRRIDSGENCSTCRFCEHREVKDKWDRQEKMGLFCQNPESYKYEGDYGYGTAASILCEYYEPKENGENKENEVSLIERH